MIVQTAGVLLLLIGGPIPLPDYDVDRLCRADPLYSDPGYVKACVESEQRAYDELKEEWPKLTEQEQQQLLALGGKARKNRYSYIEAYASVYVLRHRASAPPALFHR